MKKYNEILFVRIISITLYVFSIIILPALIGLSYLLRTKIEQAYNKFGRDETMKLINVRGLSGLLTVILVSRSKRVR